MFNELNQLAGLAIFTICGLLFFLFCEYRQKSYVEYRKRQCQTDYYFIKQSIVGQYATNKVAEIIDSIEKFKQKYLDVPKAADYADRLEKLIGVKPKESQV